MATKVFFLPGFMGSTLGLYNVQISGLPVGEKLASLWGDITSIFATPWLELLRLPSALPAGQRIIADGLAPSVLGGYSNFIQYLRENLPPGFEVVQVPYDWRLSVRDTGRTVATLIEAEAAKGSTVILVAHSQGALVGWSAWAALVDDGQTAALAKFITFGGALYGTTSTPKVFREEEAALGQIAFVQQALTRIGGSGLASAGQSLIASADTGSTEATRRALISVVGTWPGVYDLYPDVMKLDDPADANRDLLRDPSKWTNALSPPDFPTMQSEFTRVHLWLRVAKYLPPYDRCSHIIGRGFITPYQVQPAATAPPIPPVNRYGHQWPPTRQQVRQQSLPWMNETQLGDGRCTTAQQTFPGYYAQFVASAHAAMQDDPAVRLLVVQLASVPVPTPAPVNPVSVVVPPTFPSALPDVPPFVFNSDPVHYARLNPQAKPPVLVGRDP